MAKKFSVIQRWMRSKAGQTFLNFAYSWGASIVIAGALFKITHLNGADIMLFLGMGTEIIVFFLAGFEPQEAVDNVPMEPMASGAPISEETAAALANAAGRMPAGGGNGGGGVVIIGGGSGSQSSLPSSLPENAVPVSPEAVVASTGSSAPVFNSAQFNAMSPEMQESTKAYVEQLNELTETLKAVAEQSARLTRDSEEMETMNRTLTGINRFYEMQLRSVGTQSATIDEVNEQTKLLAEKLQELNEVYAKMVEALKVKIS